MSSAVAARKANCVLAKMRVVELVDGEAVVRAAGSADLSGADLYGADLPAGWTLDASGLAVRA